MELSRAEVEHYQRAAIAVCRAGIAAGNTPFGSIIVSPERQVIAAHNVVWQTQDITAHAEIHCLRKACAELRRIDLSGCWLFTTTEPCPMCAAACHWARLEQIVYGAGIADAAEAGFRELPIAAETMLAASPTKLTAGVLAPECRALFAEWKAAQRSGAY